jgi:hypothetical protein
MYHMDFVLFFFLVVQEKTCLYAPMHRDLIRLAFGLVFREMAISGAAHQKRSQKD